MSNNNVIINTQTFCVSLHTYNTTKADELSINPGDVIKVLKKADDGWWFGNKIQPPETKGGWFPSNFSLEPAEPEVINKSGPLKYAKAEYEYESREEDELTLFPGDLITVVISDEDDGWHRGVMSGRFGLFPANFVKMISRTEFDTLKGSPSKSSSTGNLSHVQNQNISSSISHLAKSGLTPHERRASLAINQPAVLDIQESLGVANKRKVLCKAIVTFEYVAQRPDELTLNKGMKLDVLEKDDEGWWMGIDELGRIGVFPFNFVKEIALPNSSNNQHESQQSAISKQHTAPETVNSKPQSPLMKFLNKEGGSQDNMSAAGSPKSPAGGGGVSGSLNKQAASQMMAKISQQKSSGSNETLSQQPPPLQPQKIGSPAMGTKQPPVIMPKPMFNKVPYTSGGGPTTPSQKISGGSSDNLSATSAPPIKLAPKPIQNATLPPKPSALTNKPQQPSGEMSANPTSPVQQQPLQLLTSPDKQQVHIASSSSSTEPSAQDLILPPLSIPAQIEKGMDVGDVYALMYKQVETLRDDMDRRLRRAKEEREMLDKEIAAMKRIIDQLLHSK